MKYFFLFFLFFLLITSSVFVSAIRVSPPNFEVTPFESGAEHDLVIRVFNNADNPYVVHLDSSLGVAESVEFSDNDFILVPGVWAHVDVHITLKSYDELSSFGVSSVGFKITEQVDPRFSSGTFAVATAIRINKKFDVPIPGKYLELHDIIIPNPNQGENTTLELKIKNKGVLDIQDATANVRIADRNNQTMTTLHFDNIDALAGEEINVSQLLDSELYDSGLYHAYGELIYSPDKLPSKKDVNFFVGGVDVLLMDYTKNLTRGKINKVEFTLQSIYSEDLTNIRGSFKDFDNQDISLPVIDFESFQSTTVDTYLDTPDSNDSTFTSTLTLQIPVPGKGVETKELPLLFNLVDEKPVELPALPKKKMSTTTKVMISLIILILLIIVLLLILSTRKDKKDHNKKSQDALKNEMSSSKKEEKSDENSQDKFQENSKEVSKKQSPKKIEANKNEQNKQEKKESFDWTE